MKVANLVFILPFVFFTNMLLANSKDSMHQEFWRLDSLYENSADDFPEKALQYSIQQEKVVKEIDVDSLKLTCWFNKARALSLLGIYDLSLETFYKGLRLSTSTKNLKFEASNLLEIARTYQSLGDYSQSISFFELSKEKQILIKSYVDTILINYEIAFNKAVLGEFSLGLESLEQNLKAAYKINDTNAIVLGLDNLSNVYAELDENSKALNYELQIFKYPSGWSSNYYKTGLFEHISEIYFKLKKYNESTRYLDSTFKYATLYNSKDWLLECYKVKSMILEAKGDYKGAFQNHQTYIALKDSVYKSNYDVKMSAMSSLYELESKQSKISLLEKDNKIKQSQRNLILFSGIGLLILVASGFWFRNQRQQQQLRIRFSRDLIDSQEAERQRISRELHDSVGQNMLFIKNQLIRKNNEEEFAPILDSVSSAIDEVRSISKDLYPNQLEKYGLSASVETMVNKVMESSDVFISADLNEVEKLLSKDKLIHVYRIIQESLNNAMKYADASSIRITADKKSTMIELIIQDNGKGFDKSILEQKAQHHFGILSIEERLHMMKGTLEIETSIGKGTKLNCFIPCE